MTTEQLTKVATVVFFVLLTILVGIGVAFGIALVQNTNELVRAQADSNIEARARTRDAVKDVERIIRNEVKTAVENHTLEARNEFAELEKNLAELLARPVKEREVIIQRQTTSTTASRTATRTTTTRTTTTQPRARVQANGSQPQLSSSTTTTCPTLPNERCKKVK